MKTLFLLLLTCFCYALLPAQTPIGGIVNGYASVTAIGNVACFTQLTVDNAAPFAAGDEVMIIQMKGAVVDSNNSVDFGMMLKDNGVGNYEFTRVATVNGNNVLLNAALGKSYYLNGAVQLIKVPEYTNADVTSTLTAQAWNGKTGGVVALFVSSTLSLHADIDVTGKGFIGGQISNNPDGACGTGSPDFYYPLVQPGFQWNSGGAEKGEGVGILNMDKMGGKGKLINGGGGGNKHNHGGGGGGGYSDGGHGGESLSGCPVDGNFGEGGDGLRSLIDIGRLIMGGGGGCGDYNNGVGSGGANGGGIIVIRANTISGNGQSIIADGADETIVGGAAADGVGGGGGGGIIFLDVQNFSSSLKLQANGGDGGDQAATYGCVGTGGGGGQGVTLITASTLATPPVTVTTMPGTAGQFVNNVCSGGIGPHYYAEDGQQIANLTQANYPFYEATGTGNPAAIGLHDTTICSGDLLVLNAGGIPNATYHWQDGSTNATYTVTTTGQYAVTVSYAGCTISDTAQVNVVARPAVNLGNDTLICSNAPLVKDVTQPGCTYHWSDATTSPVKTISTAGTYAVTVSNGGCAASDAFAVSVLNAATVQLGPDTGVCVGSVIVLHSSCDNCTYQWQDGSTDTSFTVTQSGLYSQSATNMCNTASDQTQVTMYPIPAVNLGVDTSICEGQQLILDATYTGATYAWSDGSTQALLPVTQTGNYTVSVNNNGCVATDAIAVEVIPLPKIELGPDSTICISDQLVLLANCSYCSYLWQDNSTANSFTVSQPGTYTVTATNSCGSVTDATTVKTRDCHCVAFVPNAFSPNYDGNNDNFKVQFNCNVVFFHLQLYNRWGEKVYESFDYQEGWDGNYKGKPQPQGVYVYVLTYSGDEGAETTTYKLKGSFTYLR